MSLENLKEYAQRCANEPELRETVKTIGMTDLEGQMRYAESLGLEWTMEDMAALRKEATGGYEDGLEDLSEEELEQIAGGVFTATAAVAGSVAAAAAAGAVAAVAGAGVVVAGAGAGTAAAGGGW